MIHCSGVSSIFLITGLSDVTAVPAIVALGREQCIKRGVGPAKRETNVQRTKMAVRGAVVKEVDSAATVTAAMAVTAIEVTVATVVTAVMVAIALVIVVVTDVTADGKRVTCR